MGVCAAKPAPEPEEVAVPAEPALTVAIVGARGLRGVDWFPGTDRFLFCTLSIQSQQGELHRTRLVKDTVAPFWREEAPVGMYCLGDALEFCVWDADASGEGSVLGEAVLESEDFAGRGFNGEVQLTGDERRGLYPSPSVDLLTISKKTPGCGEGCLPAPVGGQPKPSFLAVRVRLKGRAYPRGPPKEFHVVIRNPRKKSLGLDVDSQDGFHLWVLAVKAGPIQAYNEEAEPSRQVLPGDFIMKVNEGGIRAESMLDIMKKATRLELTIRRPLQFDVAVKCEDRWKSHGMKYMSNPLHGCVVVASAGDGTVMAWNQDNPDQQVRPGDRIVAVDGKKCSSRDMLRRLAAVRFHMTVVRPSLPDPELTGELLAPSRGHPRMRARRARRSTKRSKSPSDSMGSGLLEQQRADQRPFPLPRGLRQALGATGRPL